MVPDTRSAILRYSDGTDEQSIYWPNVSEPDAQLLESLVFAEQRSTFVAFYTAPLLTVVAPLEMAGQGSAMLALSVNVQPEAVEPIKRLVNWAVRWLAELMKSQPVTIIPPGNSNFEQSMLSAFVSDPQAQAFLNNTAESLAKHYDLGACLLAMHDNEQTLLGGYGVEHSSLAQQLVSFQFSSLSEEVVANKLHPFADIREFDTLLASCEKEKDSPHSLLVRHHESLQLSVCFFNHREDYFTGVRLDELQAAVEQCCMLLQATGKLSSGTQAQKTYSLQHKVSALKPLYRKPWVIAALLAFGMLFYPIEYRMPVETVIEGKIQKSIVSPFDGFVKSTFLKAGDVVEKGTVIAELDDQQLRLEVIRLKSQSQEHEKGYRKALADREYGQVNIYEAKLKQTTIKLNQVQLKLAQTELKAPIAGVIIQGDLSRSLGAPVSIGDLLFQVAPLDQYRAMLRIKETDIRFIKEGQKGELKLAALPNSVFEMSLSKSSPLFFEEDNQIIYLAEADFPEEKLDRLRPGMEGVMQVNVGRYSLGWVLSHHFVDWLRVIAWKFLP